MARLIDANVVLAKQFTTGLSDASGNYYGHADVIFVDDIENAPTVDAVEVVRCRDCAKDGMLTCPICFIENKTLQFINHSPDFYCGEGERKDGGGNA